MELDTQLSHWLFNEKEIKEIENVWKNKDQIIEKGTVMLHDNYRTRRTTKEIEKDLWIEFIEHQISYDKSQLDKVAVEGYNVTHNIFKELIGCDLMDIKSAHRFLRIKFGKEPNTGWSDKISLEDVKGYLICHSILNHLDFVYPNNIKLRLTVNSG